MLRTFFATSAKGLEEVLVRELAALGAREVKPTRAGASFRGDLATAYAVCLGSRVASRVLLPLKTFPAPNPEKLYGGCKSIRWSDHLSARTTLAVDFASTQSAITHTHFGALKVKDAIVDQLRSTQGERPSVDTQDPDVRINVYVRKDEATVSIDLSGQSLHRRGYRDESVPAPLKENLAAALLLMAHWDERSAEGAAFIDPMCGSGTLVVEAALMAGGVAPGLLRERFGFERWLGHDPKLWEKVRAEADAKAGAAHADRLPRIVGYDRDPRAIRAAWIHAERAGVKDWVHFERRDFSALEPVESRAAENAVKGLVVMNPPYGERLGETEELKPLYASIGDVLKKRFPGWEGYVLTSNPDLARTIRLDPAEVVGAIPSRRRMPEAALRIRLGANA
jgi:23S rRNA (guanine2445-N2)-methyltransferase / 23S rRNA (guanine2069-N7)-methyltransferase